ARGARTADEAPVRLGMAELERAALLFHADLRVARLEAGVARASADFAGLWDDPSVGFQWTRFVELAGRPDELFGLASLTIPLSGRLEFEKARLGAEHAVALEEVAALEWRVRMDLARAWTRWRAARALVVETRRFVAAIDAILPVVAAMEEIGELARTEARLLRIERAAAAADLVRLEADEGRLALLVAAAAGLPPVVADWLDASEMSEMSQASEASGGVTGAGAVAVHETVHRASDGDDAGSSGTESSAADASVAVEGAAVDDSPPVRVARAAYEAAERRLAEEVRRQYPDLVLGPGYGTQDGERQFQLGVSVALPLWNRNQRAIAEAEAAREVARAALERAVEFRELALASARRIEAGARAVRILVEDELLPLAEAQYAESRELARLGEVHVLGLLAGLGQLLDARQRLVEARRDEALASIEVREAIGTPVAVINGGGS
ncbi:MAG: hypothetical protein RI967_2498, partial [Planctomycetota bacterium]